MDFSSYTLVARIETAIGYTAWEVQASAEVRRGRGSKRGTRTHDVHHDDVEELRRRRVSGELAAQRMETTHLKSRRD